MKLTQTRLVLISSLFFALFFNYRFFANILKVYPLNWSNLPFLFSLALILFLAINVVFNVLRIRPLIKYQLALLFLLSSMASYYMDQIGIVIDETMYVNIFSTNLNEAKDALTIKSLLYFLLLGVLPSIALFKIKIVHKTFLKELAYRSLSIAGSVILALALILLFSKNYASFFRENKPLRYSANPIYYLYSATKLIKKSFAGAKPVFKEQGLDAKIVSSSPKRKLMIFVVGEALRADKLSLNGYAKETDPLLKKENVISLPNVYSCGTATAVSVPCMFSNLTRDDFSIEKGKYTENVLDVLKHTGQVQILWRDNNSSSKNVADRVLYEDFMTSKLNTICNEECRDLGMLQGLQEFVNKSKEGHTLIVLHQMGHHGPAYYKRYPENFKKFLPTCETNQLEKCSVEEINNTYDNVTLYTDYFLSEVIAFLKKNSKEFETMMFYISDHGESLGENGIYLHSLPYAMAPKAQKNVATILWFDSEWKKRIDLAAFLKKSQQEYSHDNLFHTILGLFDVQTSVYKQEYDIFSGLKK